MAMFYESYELSTILLVASSKLVSGRVVNW